MSNGNGKPREVIGDRSCHCVGKLEIRGAIADARYDIDGFALIDVLTLGLPGLPVGKVSPVFVYTESRWARPRRRIWKG